MTAYFLPRANWPNVSGCTVITSGPVIWPAIGNVGTDGTYPDFLRATEPKEKLVNVPSVPTFSSPHSPSVPTFFFTEESEVVIMIAVATEEMHGSD
jgi:hypothetical protein